MSSVDLDIQKVRLHSLRLEEEDGGICWNNDIAGGTELDGRLLRKKPEVSVSSDGP